MKKKILLLVICLTQISISYAQFNPDSLQPRVNRIVKSFIDTNKAAMVIVVVRKQGNDYIAHRFSFGHVRKDTNSPRPDSLTIFHIGSVTKTYTATILSMLIQSGGPIKLTDLVEQHIPLATVKAPYYVSPQNDTTRMTILDLATHFSALPDDPINPINDSTTYQMMYHYLNNHHLTRPPGQCYLYSNLGVSFLGVAVTHTLGSIIDSLFIQKISNPLGMPDTRIILNAEQESRRATGYSNGDSVGYFKDSWPAFYAAGGLYTTIRDFEKYLLFNMGLSNAGMQNVLDSAHKMRRVVNDTCTNPNSQGRIGLVWQMSPLNPQTDTNFYYTYKDGGVPGFSSFICFADNDSKDLQTGVAMITNQTIPINHLATLIMRYINNDTATTSITQLSNIIPEEFQLYQNYPNPFNPSTKIKFDIPSDYRNSDPVKLTIYDALGKEIVTLVNTRLNPGTYEAEFHNSSLPSGIYYYKISAGNFLSSKKMVLLK